MGTITTSQPGGVGTFTGSGAAYLGTRMSFAYTGATTSWTWALAAKPSGSSASLVVRGSTCFLSGDKVGDYGVQFTDSGSSNTNVTVTLEPAANPAPDQRNWVDVKSVGLKGDGVTDEGPVTQEIYDSLIGTGQSLLWTPGTYKYTSYGLTYRSGTAIPLIFSPGVTFVTALSTVTADKTGFLFYAPAVTGGSTTTTAATVLDNNTIPVASAAPLAIGNKIDILSTDGASAAQYYIINIVSSTVTLDRALTRVFPSGSSVRVVTSGVEDISITGNGALVTGTCYRYMELDHVFRGKVQGLRFDDSQGYATVGAAIFDTASYKCSFVECDFRGTSGPSFESVDEGLMSRVTAHAHNPPVSVSGIYLSDCSAWRVEGCLSDGWTQSTSFGLNLTTQGALACIDGQVVDSHFPNNNTGINVHGGGGTKMTNVTAVNCPTGMNIDSTTGFEATNLDLKNCAVAVSLQTSTLASFTNVDTSGWTNASFDCLSDALIVNHKFSSGIVNGDRNIGIRATGCTVTVQGFDYTFAGTIPSTPAMFSVAASGIIRIRNGRIHLNASAASGQVAFGSSSASGSLLDIDGVSVDGTGTPGQLFLWSGAASTPIRARDLRFPASTLTNPAFNGAQPARGSVALVAGTKVISFADLQTYDFVRVQLKTAGGTLGFLSVAMTPGTGFTINSSNAADTSTVEYSVENE